VDIAEAMRLPSRGLNRRNGLRGSQGMRTLSVCVLQTIPLKRCDIQVYVNIRVQKGSRFWKDYDMETHAIQSLVG